MRALNIETVTARLGLEVAEVYTKMESNGFPQPVKFGGTRVWIESEVEAWASRNGYSDPAANKGSRTVKQIKADKKKHDLFFDEQSNALTGRSIRSHKEIVRAAQAGTSARVCGVYFLVRGDRVVYVGQSTNIYARAANHFNNKTFDAWSFIPCEEKDLDVIESLYIHFLQPSQNGRIGNTDMISVPLSLDELLPRITLDTSKEPAL